MDKSSVLGEAIKHIKQLQERVKNLEEDNGRKMVESGVLVKQSQVALEDDDLSSSGDNVNEDPSKTNSYQDEDFLSGIDVRVWKNNLLLKLQCERQEAILPKILTVLEKNHLLISTVHVTPFGDKNFDITVIAQVNISSIVYLSLIYVLLEIRLFLFKSYYCYCMCLFTYLGNNN